ncbi:Far upstream element-binding protein 1 [Choanephora cucurbitarum]|uniref:Far upstream element-binding protein 1 n=1 Tax=Choanephora cucurbitarum TaxID=101091 RepID=A0A1C7NQ11_9FUNG|nr:Far upstream element-binding protein 1 [Choanephora cucurbitarum]
MSGKDYSAVPPPDSLARPSNSAPVNFNDALSKARAIAEKLKQQSAGNASASMTSSVSPQQQQQPSYSSYNSSSDYNSSSSSGTKRSYDDHTYRAGPLLYGSQNEHDNKRTAYDSGSSRSSYGSGPKRYGLGSEERKSHHSHYGGSGGQQSHQEEYSVPNHMVGLLIGKGGENLKKIERMSGVTKVQFASDPVGDQRPVHLTGEADQIAVARDMIRQMVADAKANESNRYGNRSSNDYSSSRPSSSESTLTIRIPSSKVGLVIGRGGETIRDFEERSKAKIFIVSDSHGERDNERVINLVGEMSAAQHAKTLIEGIVFGSNNYGGYGSGMGRHDERVFVTVPSSAVGLIIGRGGETVRSMQEQSGARVKIDPTNDPNAKERTVNISGDPKAVSIAKQMVEDKVAEASRGRSGGYQQHDYNNAYSQPSSQQQQQYGQYYGQYGYDQYGGYQQYPDYYHYPQGDQASSNGPHQEASADDSKEKSDKDDQPQNHAESQGGPDAVSAYYAQYYGGQQPTQEQQEAYYQWYQQYYGQQQQAAPLSSENAEQANDEKAADTTSKDHPTSTSTADNNDDIDGEPIPANHDDTDN